MWIPVVLAVCLHLAAGDVCPGGRGQCSKGMTCCELPSGLQGCCPYDNATCCSDHVHCCPDGFRCLTGRCEKEGSDELLRLTKLMVDYEELNNSVDKYEEPSHTVVKYRNESSSVGNVCPDDSVCPGTETCCKMATQPYGCCKYPDATCCSDLVGCCPTGYKCIAGGMCQGNSNTMFIRAPAKQMAVKQRAVNTICPGGVYTCPTGDTCCPHGYGQWACCPLLAATCCSDQLHCCPHGMRCDGRGYCLKGDE